MAYGTGSSDSTSTLLFVGVVLLATLGAGWWYAQERQPAPTSTVAGVVSCPDCNGGGKTRCGRCWGHGKVIYIGKGPGTCNGCGGARTTVCSRCKGAGTVASQQPSALK